MALLHLPVGYPSTLVQGCLNWSMAGSNVWTEWQFRTRGNAFPCLLLICVLVSAPAMIACGSVVVCGPYSTWHCIRGCSPPKQKQSMTEKDTCPMRTQSKWACRTIDEEQVESTTSRLAKGTGSRKKLQEKKKRNSIVCSLWCLTMSKTVQESS